MVASQFPMEQDASHPAPCRSSIRYLPVLVHVFFWTGGISWPKNLTQFPMERDAMHPAPCWSSVMVLACALTCFFSGQEVFHGWKTWPNNPFTLDLSHVDSKKTGGKHANWREREGRRGYKRWKRGKWIIKTNKWLASDSWWSNGWMDRWMIEFRMV